MRLGVLHDEVRVANSDRRTQTACPVFGVAPCIFVWVLRHKCLCTTRLIRLLATSLPRSRCPGMNFPRPCGQYLSERMQNLRLCPWRSPVCCSKPCQAYYRLHPASPAPDGGLHCFHRAATSSSAQACIPFSSDRLLPFSMESSGPGITRSFPGNCSVRALGLSAVTRKVLILDRSNVRGRRQLPY